jgi:hypothetical protein
LKKIIIAICMRIANSKINSRLFCAIKTIYTPRSGRIFMKHNFL